MTKYGKYDKYGRVQEIRQLCDVPYKTAKNKSTNTKKVERFKKNKQAQTTNQSHIYIFVETIETKHR